MIRCLIVVAGLCAGAGAVAQNAPPPTKPAPKHYEQEQASPLIAPEKAIKAPNDAAPSAPIPPSRADKPAAPPPKDPAQGVIQITTRNCREVQ
ncbi:MAG: hypothetical protein ACK4NS_08705 [Saprospiraceae bacterium]